MQVPILKWPWAHELELIANVVLVKSNINLLLMDFEDLIQSTREIVVILLKILLFGLVLCTDVMWSNNEGHLIIAIKIIL